MAITTNQKPTIYRNLYENTGPDEDDPSEAVSSHHEYDLEDISNVLGGGRVSPPRGPPWATS